MANAVVMTNCLHNVALAQDQRQPLLTCGAKICADGRLSGCSSRLTLQRGARDLTELSCIHSSKCPLSHDLVPSRRQNSRKNCPSGTLNVVRAAARVESGVASPSASPTEAKWRIKRDFLLKARVRSVSPKDALKLQQKHGYKIVDVRPEGDYKESHPAGAVNAQVYRLIKDWTLWDISRRVAFAFFGMFRGTEPNPAFVEEVKGALQKDDKIILACSAGGSIKPSPDFAEGTQSRSLIAAYLLALEGFTGIAHMEGGLKEWFKQNLPLED